MKDVENTVNHLRNTGKYTNEEIQHQPNVLGLNVTTIENRSNVFQECSFRDVLLSFLVKYVSIMNKKVNILKAHDYINPEANVAKNLAQHLKLNVMVKDNIGENIAINELRQKLLNLFLKEELKCSSPHIEKLWKTYPRLRQRNFQDITVTVKILKESLNLTNEKIVNNGYLLYAEPKNILNILKEVPTIAGTGKIILSIFFPLNLTTSSNSRHSRNFTA